MQKAIIIGSGIGGMATAIRLAVKGYEVHVFEQNSYPGGKLSLLEQGGYRFDKGPSLFTQPQLLEELFAFAGENILDFFQYQQLDTICHYLYEDGTLMKAFFDKEKLCAEIEEKFGVKAQVIQDYLTDSQTLYQKIGWIFLEKSLHKAGTWLDKSILPALSTVKFDYLFNSLHNYNKKKLKDPRLVQFFDRFATYNGSNPYQCPAMLSVIPKFEMLDGAFYPKGGMISITNALFRLAEKKGVQFHFNSPVEKILFTGKKATKIQVKEQTFAADVIVSNMDAYFTYKKLLRQEDKAQDILKQERSSSALIFYWGMKKSFPQLHLHNIAFSNNYEAEFDCIFTQKTLYPDPTIYINITSKIETEHAPDGCENWFVLVNVPTNTGQNWVEWTKITKANVLKKMSSVLGENIAQYIETEAILDPILIEKNTSSYQGSLYGTSSNSQMAAFLRHPNFSTKIENLYFVGGSVHPGGGIPLCMLSASIVGDLVPNV